MSVLGLSTSGQPPSVSSWPHSKTILASAALSAFFLPFLLGLSGTQVFLASQQRAQYWIIGLFGVWQLQQRKVHEMVCCLFSDVKPDAFPDFLVGEPELGLLGVPLLLLAVGPVDALLDISHGGDGAVPLVQVRVRVVRRAEVLTLPVGLNMGMWTRFFL